MEAPKLAQKILKLFQSREVDLFYLSSDKPKDKRELF